MLAISPHIPKILYKNFIKYSINKNTEVATARTEALIRNDKFTSITKDTYTNIEKEEAVEPEAIVNLVNTQATITVWNKIKANNLEKNKK